MVEEKPALIQGFYNIIIQYHYAPEHSGANVMFRHTPLKGSPSGENVNEVDPFKGSPSRGAVSKAD